MNQQLAELIPLFFDETRGRLGRLVALAPRVGEEEVEAEARRELHTLRGSCRLLELAQMAELCRAGEELLEIRPPDLRKRLEEILGRFDVLLEEAAGRWESSGSELGFD